MLFLIWMVALAIISIIWAFDSLKKERQRHEIEKARREMTSGRVIFHSSDVSESESSL